MAKIKPKDRPHYVNNRFFSESVVKYCEAVIEAKKNEEAVPIVPDYIADCFLKISNGLSHKSNFALYSYKEEMQMDGVENCLRAIHNYNIETATRTGNPNAFAYFTQIVYFAFLRRIAKEKKQQDIKMKYISESNIFDYMVNEQGSAQSSSVATAFVDQLKQRISTVKTADQHFSEYAKKAKRKKRQPNADSDLTKILND